jgi:tRNA G37 N-methylase Trm5
VVLSKESLLQQAGTFVQKNPSQKSNRYSQVAVSRSKNKKTSFRMMLHNEVQQQTINIKAEDNDVPVIVTMGQEENADLRQMLNSFYEEESYMKSNTRNHSLLEEVVKQAEFLTSDDRNLLKNLMEEV